MDSSLVTVLWKLRLQSEIRREELRAGKAVMLERGPSRSGRHGSAYITAQCYHTSLVCLSFTYQLLSVCT